MVDKFEATIDKFVTESEQKMLIVARESIKAVVDESQTTVSDGGKMRVDTGFLRSTGLASLNAPPIGPSVRDKTQKYSWSGDSVTATLARMKFGDVFYFGWTANYAKYREVYDGFLISALQNFQQYVNESIRRFKR